MIKRAASLRQLKQALENAVASKGQEVTDLELRCERGRAYIAGLRDALEMFEGEGGA